MLYIIQENLENLILIILFCRPSGNCFQGCIAIFIIYESVWQVRKYVVARDRHTFFKPFIWSFFVIFSITPFQVMLRLPLNCLERFWKCCPHLPLRQLPLPVGKCTRYLEQDKKVNLDKEHCSKLIKQFIKPWLRKSYLQS